ncbi:hypothetical protein KSF_107340 [Reticulibacter mediterranei]|uniref:Uncharacterized protein n=1 Tax=Reticulibacter mediterranei TaxID=2778369 RepID=A0A8J3J4R4_9CHLR|nr:hypothetical protein [Reticulibacter mediterranei]GHP00687.1 hypothetical protein KSF_107340 [Reticulibacter mediterranei]
METIAGKHFSVTPQQITVFGLQGMHWGNRWAVGIPFGRTVESYMFTEIAPAPVLAEIEGVLEEHGNEHLLISNRVAVRLFLEGRLPMEAFMDAQETDERSVTLTLPLAGKERQVKIQSEFDLTQEIAPHQCLT